MMWRQAGAIANGNSVTVLVVSNNRDSSRKAHDAKDRQATV